MSPTPQSIDTPPTDAVLPDDPSLVPPTPAESAAPEFPTDPLPELPLDDDIIVEMIDPASNGFELVEAGIGLSLSFGGALLAVAILAMLTLGFIAVARWRLVAAGIAAASGIAGIVLLTLVPTAAPAPDGMPAWAEESYKVEITDRQAALLATGGTAVINFNGAHTAIEAPLAADGKLYLVNAGTGIELPPDPALFGAPVYPDVITEEK